MPVGDIRWHVGNNLLGYVLVFFAATTPYLETRDRVAVIDTGLSKRISQEYICIDGHFDSTKTSIYDEMRHGEFVTEILAENMQPKIQCLTMLKWVPENPWSLFAALKKAAALKPKYLNLSFGGYESYSYLEQSILNEMLRNGTQIAVAAGNDRVDLSKRCSYFPACYRFPGQNYYVVASCRSNHSYESYTNYGGTVNACEDGDIYVNGQYVQRGTSFATPRYLGKKIREQ